MIDNPLGVDHVLGLDETGGPLEPWLVRGAIGVIEAHMSERQDPRVIEYGSGSGTPWLCERAERAISVEHLAPWAEKVSALLDEMGLTNHRMIVEPLGDGYVMAIEEEGGPYDLVIVDGRLRVKCVRTAINHVAPDGMLVLDNSERPYYKPAIDLLDGLGWERSDFENSLWHTTIWRRSSDGLVEREDRRVDLAGGPCPTGAECDPVV